MAPTRTDAHKAAQTLAKKSWNPLHPIRKSAAARVLHDYRDAKQHRTSARSSAKTTKVSKSHASTSVRARTHARSKKSTRGSR